ncbi:MAG: hypothetical protein L0229_17190 [Blastocatellia bacterium]|nr:hypothetical protein [Blastocatellia bacterium]
MTPGSYAQAVPKKEYVIGMPTGYQMASLRFRRSLQSVDTESNIKILDSLGEDKDKLALLTETEVQSLKSKMPGH